MYLAQCYEQTDSIVGASFRHSGSYEGFCSHRALVGEARSSDAVRPLNVQRARVEDPGRV